MHPAVTRTLKWLSDNPQQPIDLHGLSQAVGCSAYHLHRLFRAATGWPLHAYMRRWRLDQAAHRLIREPHTGILDIALDSGFQSAEAFSRAFREYTGRSPSQFRIQPHWPQPIFHQEQSMQPQVDIVTTPTLQLACIEHCGPMQSLLATLQPFIQWRRANGLSPHSSRTFNLYLTDPHSVEPQQNRVLIGVETPAPMQAPELNIYARQIPPMRWAKARHVGSWAGVEAVARYLYAEWLAANGESLADFPLMIERVNLYPDTPEHALISDIYLPLMSEN